MSKRDEIIKIISNDKWHEGTKADLILTALEKEEQEYCKYCGIPVQCHCKPCNPPEKIEEQPKDCGCPDCINYVKSPLPKKIELLINYPKGIGNYEFVDTDARAKLNEIIYHINK